MAATEIKVAKIPNWNGNVVYPTPAAVDGSDKQATVEMGADQKMVIFVNNANGSAAKTVTFKAGDGIQGVNDMTVSITNGETKCFVVESGRFCTKGKITLVGETTDIKVSAIELP